MFQTEVGSRTNPFIVLAYVLAFVVIGVLCYSLGPVVAGYANIVRP